MWGGGGHAHANPPPSRRQIHLLNDERGPVIEAIVARTLRQVEALQSRVRIVGLSATLPNYEVLFNYFLIFKTWLREEGGVHFRIYASFQSDKFFLLMFLFCPPPSSSSSPPPQDVAVMIRCDVSRDLFFFSNAYRPVPLHQTFVGISAPNPAARAAGLQDLALRLVGERVRQGHQCMVFVHARRETGRTARALLVGFQLRGGGVSRWWWKEMQVLILLLLLLLLLLFYYYLGGWCSFWKVFVCFEDWWVEMISIFGAVWLSAQMEGMMASIAPSNHPNFPAHSRAVQRARSRELAELLENGLAIHHAG
jgi:hypothetical protein